MNAVKLLKKDHQRVRKLFDQYAEAGDRSSKRKREIAETIFQELEVHRRLEEEIFYPAVNARGSQEVQELVIENLEEHQEVGTLIEELRELDPADDAYQESFAQLVESVQEHIEAEESEMFPEAEKRLRDQLDEIGSQMEEEKEMASTR
jgi:hemerythrin-like domain-containing protein